MTILQIKKSVLLALFLALSASSVYAQNPVALGYYSFDGSGSGSSAVLTNCSGTSPSSLTATSASINSTYLTGTPGTGKALTTDHWSAIGTGTDPLTTTTKYISLTINTTGFYNIGLTADFKSSNTNANHLNKFNVFYQKGSGSKTMAFLGLTGSANSTQTLGSSFGTSKWNFGTGADNASTVTIYIYAYGGNSVASTDAMLIDNLFIHCTSIKTGTTLADYSKIISATAVSGTSPDSYKAITACSIDATGNTVILSSNLNVKPTSGSTTSITVTNGTLDCGTYTITTTSGITNTITLASGTILSTANTSGLSGTSNSTFSTASGTYVFSLDVASTINYNSSGSQNITVNNGVGANVIYGNLTITDRASGTLTFDGTTFKIGGTYTVPYVSDGHLTYTVNNGNVFEFTSNSSQTIPAFPYNDLTSSGSGARILDGTNPITIGGNFTKGSNTYTITGSTVYFTGISTLPAFNFNNVGFYGTSTLGGDITIQGGATLTINGSAILDAGVYTISQAGVGTANVQINSSATLKTGNTDGHKGSSSGTIRTTNMSIGIDAASYIEYNGTGAQTVIDDTYGFLTISNDHAGTTVTFSNSTDLYIQGDFTCTAISVLYNATGVKFHFSGTGNSQNVSGFPTYDYVYIEGGTTKVVNDQDMTINLNLTITSGLLQLGSFNCIITSGGSITGGDLSSFILTDNPGDGFGNLIMDNTSGDTYYPIGQGTFRPVTLNGGGASCAVGVMDGATDGNSTPIVWRAVSSTWNITCPNTSVDVTLQWNTSDQLFYLFDDNHIFMANRDALNVPWTQLTIPTVAANGTDPYSHTQTAVALNASTIKYFGVGDQYSALPVTLTNFKANKVNDHTAKLLWNTSSEINNSGFEIQRSTNGQLWEKVNFTSGHGTTQIPQEYTYLDENMPNVPVVYYRLNQIDFNGTSQLTNIRTVNNDATHEALALLVAPNPAKDKVTLSAANAMPGNYTLRITDINGKVVTYETVNADSKIFKHSLDVSGWQNGQYLVSVISDNGVNNTIFVKQ